MSEINRRSAIFMPMEEPRTEELLVTVVKCKHCGRIVEERNLHRFSYTYDNHEYHVQWCLCDECISKGIHKPKRFITVKNHRMRKDATSLLKELAQTVLRYMVDFGDDWHLGKESYRMNEFFGKIFNYGGTIGELGQEQDNGDYKGVYIIARPDSFQKIGFEEHSPAGWFKGKDPTVPIATLKDKWVDNANILYIGKHEKSVRKRMQQHIDFYNGKPIAAWGGRIISQIINFEDLEVWYLSCENPTKMEKALLNEFKTQYKKLPFANWKL